VFGGTIDPLAGETKSAWTGKPLEVKRRGGGNRKDRSKHSVDKNQSEQGSFRGTRERGWRRES